MLNRKQLIDFLAGTTIPAEPPGLPGGMYRFVRVDFDDEAANSNFSIYFEAHWSSHDCAICATFQFFGDESDPVPTYDVDIGGGGDCIPPSIVGLCAYEIGLFLEEHQTNMGLEISGF